ncbi:protein of unknown function [Bradyrhizobium vignae]|uniref:Acyl-CoA dehydrogenase/oxidase C-terminal domain-containing protein n=1 Tax=Bradyrhizobium vignae TaxID=1549949 RepID=A0A2U3QAD9_9BRAD|nr:protein of unknown function [Bradyrhizobium vignae]
MTFQDFLSILALLCLDGKRGCGSAGCSLYAISRSNFAELSLIPKTVRQAGAIGLHGHVRDDHANEQTARERAMSAAEAQIGQSAKTIGCESIRLHGGGGMTMEYRRALFQARHHDRHAVRRFQPSLAPTRRPGRPHLWD